MEASTYIASEKLEADERKTSGSKVIAGATHS